MIYDLTMLGFEAELDVLEIRLAELEDVVDQHIIVEANRTYSGKPKQLHLAMALGDRFKRWQHKINYAPVLDVPTGEQIRRRPYWLAEPCESDNWVREKHQRDVLSNVLPLLDLDKDVLFLSDLDEIPRPEVFAEGIDAARGGLIARPRLAMHVYRSMWRWPDTLPVIARFFSPATLRDHDGSIEKVRQQPGLPFGPREAPGLGWHLAYMGGLQAIQEKLAGAAHHELDVAPFNTAVHIRESLDRGVDLFSRDRPVEITPSNELPPYLVANADRLKVLL